MGIYQFLPSYVGSKKQWVERLRQDYSNSEIVEPFCGSSVLSANLATTAILNDNDKYIYLILSQFDQLIVPDRFTKEDYFNVRPKADWWKYAYCLQKMSFSGVFRYSRNGYNVPIKPNIPFVELRESYEIALKRWRELSPEVLNQDYLSIESEKIKNKLLILDPPYETSQASYNTKFDYPRYWQFVQEMKEVASAIILFDKQENLLKQNIPTCGNRNMRVNGKRAGSVESIAIFRNGKWQEYLGTPTEGLEGI